MNPQTILRVDRWFGKPICVALSALRKVGRLVWPFHRIAPPPQKILFIKMTEQGATVLAYRALARAVELVGRENVYFWVFEENRPILDLLDVIPAQNVLALRAKRPLTFAIDIVGTLWRIRRLHIDTTIDMEFFARASAILAFLSGARRRIGMHRFTAEGPYRGDLLTHRIQYNPYIHTAMMHYLLVESALEDGREWPMPKRTLPQVDLAPPRFQPFGGELEDLRSKLQQAATPWSSGPIVLLNANASDMLPLRRWPSERFVELARRLLASDDQLLVVFTGGRAEADGVDQIVQQVGSPRAVSMAGKTTLRELLVLFTLADVLVTNDSGPGHFASMTAIDTIVLFGPETPALYGPVGDQCHVIHAGLACSPCVNVYNHRFSPCHDNKCMQAIDVAQVQQAVVSALANRQNREQANTVRKRAGEEFQSTPALLAGSLADPT